MKYYVVTFLGENVNEGAFCSVCGVYTELKNAKSKMQEVIREEQKMLDDNGISYKVEDSETKYEIYDSGDWSYTIDLQIVDEK